MPDLHIFFDVVQSGSMAKAAAQIFASERLMVALSRIAGIQL
jgi:hypothetical protein